MALATTCPQCKTSFKVVPDQLKLRRGLVRCGVCQHVFSGIDYLRYVDDSKAQQRSPPVGVATPTARPAWAAGAAAPAPPGAPRYASSHAADAADSSSLDSRSDDATTDGPLKTALFVPDTEPATGRDAHRTTTAPSDVRRRPADEPEPADRGHATDAATRRPTAGGLADGDGLARESSAVTGRRDDADRAGDALTGLTRDEPAWPPDDGAEPAISEHGRQPDPGAGRGPWGFGLLRRGRGERRSGAGADVPAAPATQRVPAGSRQAVQRRDAFSDDAAELSPHTQIAPLDDDDSSMIGRDTMIRHHLIIDEEVARAEKRTADGNLIGHDDLDLETAHRHARDSRDFWRGDGTRGSGLADSRPPEGRRRLAHGTRFETFDDLVATPGRRYGLIALAVLALVQSALVFRDELASSLPFTRPVLAVLGAPFGVEPGPVRSINDLSIEAFDIQASGQDDRLNLSAVIRNRSDRPVRWPAMELTLTDPTRAVVVRKVIIPATYLPQSDGRAGIGPRSEQPIRLVLDPRNVQLAGYTVALFYP